MENRRDCWGGANVIPIDVKRVSGAAIPEQNFRANQWPRSRKSSRAKAQAPLIGTCRPAKARFGVIFKWEKRRCGLRLVDAGFSCGPPGRCRLGGWNAPYLHAGLRRLGRDYCLER